MPGPDSTLTPASTAPPGLRQLVVRGGKYLVFRQGAGVLIGLVGILLLTRVIGPSQYGVYAGALAIVVFAAGIGRLGVEVFLVRREEPPDSAVYGQAFTLLLVSGLLLAGISLLSLPLLRAWTLSDGNVAPIRTLFLVVPLMLLHQPAFAVLERKLDFRTVAYVELAGQLSFYAVALPLALLGAGVWAPVAGFWVWQTCLLTGAYATARFRPRLVWSLPLIRELLSYGFRFSAASWLWELRMLVNPLIVGHFLGAASVGHVSLAMRFVEVLSVVRAATYRLSIAALARVQNDHARLRRIIEEAMTLQILGVAPLLAVGSVMLWFLPLILGEQWEPVRVIFPFLALSSLLNAVFNMHSSALYVLKRNKDVALFHLAYVALFAGSAFLLVPLVGAVGYGLGELVAVAAYFVIHRKLTRVVPLTYRHTARWLFGLAPGMFAVLLPRPWAFILAVPTVVLMLLPSSRRLLRGYASQFRAGAGPLPTRPKRLARGPHQR